MEEIDDYYVWQRRIHHGIRNQKFELPFPASVEIGLEFNAALERTDKLDQNLLTNAVILEICEFAKTVTRSEKYFLFEILDFNFDLGVDVDNDMEFYEYATRVHIKMKQLKESLKPRPHKWAETFRLPDVIKASTESDASKRYYPKRNKFIDISVLTDANKNRESSENQTSQNKGATSSTLAPKTKGGCCLKLPGEGYPFCKKAGLSLTVRPHNPPKQKLDPNLVTVGLVIELLDFCRVLCGTCKQMVNDIVKQNFGVELDKIMFRLQLNKLIERKHACLTPEDKDAFRKETFQVQYKKRQRKQQRKRKNPDTDFQDLEIPTVASKRRASLRHREGDAYESLQDCDLSYMCPVDFEAELQLDAETGTDKNEPDSLSALAVDTESVSVSLDAQNEDEAFPCSVQPRANGSNFHLNDWSPKAKGSLFSEDKFGDKRVKTPKQKLWMRRAARSKQLLRSSRVSDLFAHCREIGLDFNVGSGNKQNLDLQLLTNWVLLEAFKFATAMTKSLRSFLFDILGNNFHLSFQDDTHLRNFIYYVITKERALQNHPDRKKAEFLSRPFHFPEVYNIVDVSSYSQTELELKQEQQENWDSSGSATIHEKQADQHPFCRELGVNLWSSKERAETQKLELTVLTTGAVLEIFAFAREMCGSVREIVNDVLEHNFDVDLQVGSSEAAQVMQRWYATQKSLMKKQNMSPKVNSWLNSVVPLNEHSSSDGGPVDWDAENHTDPNNSARRGCASQLAKFSGFHTCKKIGLDLEIDSKSAAKTKLNLQVLTRGVLFEVHRYVEQNCNRYVPALYEILEYNFDLSSQNHRKVEFAWSIASQVIAMVGKSGRNEGYFSKVFELPMEVSESPQIFCKEESEHSWDKPDFADQDDIMFVRKLKPVDLEVELD